MRSRTTIAIHKQFVFLCRTSTATQAVENDTYCRTDRQVIVLACAANGVEYNVCALEHGGREPKAGAEEKHYRPALPGLDTCAEFARARPARGPGRGMDQERWHTREFVRLGNRRIEIRNDPDDLQRFASARIVEAAVIEPPVIDHRPGELALLGYRMHDEGRAHVISTSAAGEVVDVETRDRGGHRPAIAIQDRVMEKRDEEIGHAYDLRLVTRSGRRLAVRFSASALRHARIFA